MESISRLLKSLKIWALEKMPEGICGWKIAPKGRNMLKRRGGDEMGGWGGDGLIKRGKHRYRRWNIREKKEHIRGANSPK